MTVSMPSRTETRYGKHSFRVNDYFLNSRGQLVRLTSISPAGNSVRLLNTERGIVYKFSTKGLAALVEHDDGWSRVWVTV